MNIEEKKLSDYIDSLNQEKQPIGHGEESISFEMQEPLEKVRMVKSLKEASLPENDYTRKLASALNGRLTGDDPMKGRKRSWLFGTTAAAVFTAVFLLYMTSAFDKADIVKFEAFIKGVTVCTVDLKPVVEPAAFNPKVKVPVDLKAEEGDQKNADAGHSPWKLDPAFVAQVFVSLKMSPQGIQGEYPIKTEDLKVVSNTGKEAIVEVSGNKTPVRRVYLKRLVRQGPTGVWTVVGYDPSGNE